MRSILLTVAASLVLAAPAGAQDPVTVPGSSGAVTSRVAQARNGTVAVAWGSGKVAIRRADGSWQSLHHVAASNRSVTGVDVAFDSRDKLIVTWVQAASAPGHATRGPFAVEAATWTSGSGWGAAHVLGHSGHFLAADPSVTTNSAGDALISWRGVRRNASHQIRDCVSTSFRPAGGAFGHEQQISDGGPYQDVALDDHGNAYAVWTQSTGNSTTNRFAYRKRGSGWGSPKTFSANPSSAPVLAVTPDHTVVIAYRGAQADSEGNGTQSGAIFTIARSPSGTFGAAAQLSTDPAHDANIAVSDTGEVTIVWGATTLHYSSRPPDGDPSPEQTITGSQAGPVVYTSHGDALIAYGDDKQVFLIERPHTDSVFGAPSAVGSDALYPALSTRGAHAAVTWLDQGRNRLKLFTFSV